MKKLTVMLMILCLLVSMAGCAAMSGGAAMDNASAELVQEPMAASPMEDVQGQSASTELPEGRKWIITVDLSAETENLEGLLTALNERISDLEGYIESQNIYNGSAYSGRRYRSASMTIRIPADQVNAFTAEIAGIANVVSKNQQLEDVTLRYVATQSRMNALMAEEERLLALVEQAQTVSDLLEIEARLTDVRYELERVTSQLRVYDNLVDYATIYLDIDEVQTYTPVEEPALWERISGGFVDSLKGLWTIVVEIVVWVIVKLPYLLVLGGILWLITFWCKRSKKRRMAKYPPQQPPCYPPHPPVVPENQEE